MTDNKTIIERALAGLAAPGGVAALADVLSEDFVHHRPDSTSNKEEWLAAVQAVPLADLQVEVSHLLADGDLVVLHSARRLAGAGPGITGVHLWRLRDGSIVEGWEIIEPVADAAANYLWWQAR